MFLALRELRAGRGRFVLVGTVIALIALLTTLLSGLATGLVDDGISGLRSLPLTHLAFEPGAKASFSRSTLHPRELDAWKQVSGVEVAPVGVSFFNAERSNGDTIDLALFGTPADSFLIPGGDPVRAGDRGLVLNREHEEDGIRVGDTLTIAGPDEELPVVGFVDSGSYGHVAIAFSTLETWQHLVYGDNARDRFAAVAVRAPDGATVIAPEGTEVVTKEGAYAGSPGFSAETSTMDLIRGFLLVISALVVGAFFTVWTIQRTRQIGLMKALGATNGYVLRDALGQLLIVLAAATGLGALVAFGLGSLVGEGAPFRLEASTVVTSSLVLIVLGLVGSLTAIRRVTSVDPLIALSSEH